MNGSRGRDNKSQSLLHNEGQATKDSKRSEPSAAKGATGFLRSVSRVRENGRTTGVHQANGGGNGEAKGWTSLVGGKEAPRGSVATNLLGRDNREILRMVRLQSVGETQGLNKLPAESTDLVAKASDLGMKVDMVKAEEVYTRLTNEGSAPVKPQTITRAQLVKETSFSEIEAKKERNIQMLLSKPGNLRILKEQAFTEVDGQDIKMVWLAGQDLSFIVVVLLDEWVMHVAPQSKEMATQVLAGFKLIRCYAFSTQKTWDRTLSDIQSGALKVPKKYLKG